MEKVIVADTSEARRDYERNKTLIDAAAERYAPVVIGPSGVVFYDQREYYPFAAGPLK